MSTRARLLPLLAAALLACTALGVAPPPQAAARRVVMISFDSGTDWIADRLISEGKAPALAAVARDGASADAMISVLPTLTAVAHASFWTGAFPRAHGATDNYMPRTPTSDHTLLETRSGYLSDVLTAEPIWETAARAGKRVLVMQASGAYPFTPRYRDRLTHFDVYANELLRSEVVAGTLSQGPLRFRIGETEAAASRGPGRSIVLTVGDTRAELQPGTAGFSQPLTVTVGGVHGLVRVGLLEHDIVTGRVLLVHGDVARVVGTDDAKRDDLVAEAGVTFGEAGAGHYNAGRFGPTLADDGDGRAERHLVNTTLANQQYFDGLLRYAARQQWDLLTLYVPSMDIAGHALAGMLDPDTPGHDPALAARVWPFYEDLFRRSVDDYVAEIRRLVPEAAIVIGSDHGVEGMRRQWFPNAVLREAGLLVEGPDGRTDLARSRAVVLSGHSGAVFVNSTRYRGGIVPESERQAVKRLVTSAMLSARDPESGTPLVRNVVDVDLDGEALGVGGEVAPDLFVDPAPGYFGSARTGQRAFVGPANRRGWGVHGPFPTRRRLHAFFLAVGPGVPAGARLGIVRQVDAAPTVARLLGIAPPADAVGRALFE